MATTSRPTPVTIAVVFMWMQAILALLLAIAAFVLAGNRKAMDDIAGGTDAGSLGTAVTLAGVVLAVVAVINVIFALRIGRGGATARLIYTVIGIVGIVANVVTGITTRQSSHWAVVVIPVVILALLWVPQSAKAFFTKATAA